MKRDFNGTKGAVTVEACIAFPVFLCFFLFLIFLIRVICMDMVLQNAANEAAKELAAAAYPVKFINELEDDVFLDKGDYRIPSFKEELEKVKGYIAGNMEKDTGDIINMLVSGKVPGEFKSNDLSEVLNLISGETLKGLESGARAYITVRYGKDYYNIKNRLKYMAVWAISERTIREGYIDRGKLEIPLVQLPQSMVEHGIRSRDTSYKKACQDIGYTPERDDVVVALQYEVKIPIPFLNDRTVVLKHAAVERAWINGSSGVFSMDYEIRGKGNSQSDKPGEVEESYRKQLDETVYITNTGTKYHKADCPCLSSSRKPLKLSDAEDKGYKKCGVCSNKGKWNFYK